MTTAEDYLFTKRKWRDLERARIREMFRVMYKNAHAAQPKFIESAFALWWSFWGCVLIVLLAVGMKGCEPGTAQAGEIGIRNPSTINKATGFIEQKSTISPKTAIWTDEEIVNAIFRVENSKSHPYGIMVKYKHTTPRQACFNTVRHKRTDWIKNGSKGDFLTYLASKYAPLNASNDPHGLNANWESNLRLILAKNRRIKP